MSQNDFNIANQVGASFRADVNLALQALASQSAGATAPATTYAYMPWYDTTTGLLKFRNGADSAWVIFGPVADSAAHKIYTNNLERVSVDSSGNVGINKTSPAYKLDVDGDVNVTGAFKVNGVDIPTSAGVIIGGTTGGSATAYTATPSPAITGYASSQFFLVFWNATNTTTTPTINFNGQGAKAIKKQIGSGKVAVAVGDCQQNTFGLLGYDGTDIVLMNPRPNSQGANIASAATINLDTATGDYVHITGTTDITAVTLSQGRQCTVVFDDVLTVTNGASLLIPGGTDVTTAAGDVATVRGEASGVVRVISYAKGDGSGLSGGGNAPISSGVIAEDDTFFEIGETEFRLGYNYFFRAEFKTKTNGQRIIGTFFDDSVTPVELTGASDYTWVVHVSGAGHDDLDSSMIMSADYTWDADKYQKMECTIHDPLNPDYPGFIDGRHYGRNTSPTTAAATFSGECLTQNVVTKLKVDIAEAVTAEGGRWYLYEIPVS